MYTMALTILCVGLIGMILRFTMRFFLLLIVFACPKIISADSDRLIFSTTSHAHYKYIVFPSAVQSHELPIILNRNYSSIMNL